MSKFICSTPTSPFAGRSDLDNEITLYPLLEYIFTNSSPIPELVPVIIIFFIKLV